MIIYAGHLRELILLGACAVIFYAHVPLEWAIILLGITGFTMILHAGHLLRTIRAPAEAIRVK
jgi:hypothetical protein